MKLAEATVVAEKYEIIKALGRGGMGIVYLARQAGMDRQVAIKFLDSTLDANKTVERFRREAKIMSNLKHRNLVASYELGTWKGAVYLVMEYVEGHSLESELAKGALEPNRAVEIGKQIAEALVCAHANGVVHRDLKPSNVLITKGIAGEEVIKVIDFGLAKLTDAAAGKTVVKLTATGCTVGTVYYMSPEQCSGQTIDERSDIYGLGALLYHCITGKPPFNSPSVVAVMAQHLNSNPESIDREEVPTGLDSIIFRCLSKAPADRYQKAEQVVEALNLVASGRGGDVTVCLPGPPGGLRADAEDDEEPEEEQASFPRVLQITCALAVLVLALVSLDPLTKLYQFQAKTAVEEEERRTAVTQSAPPPPAKIDPETFQLIYHGQELPDSTSNARAKPQPIKFESEIAAAICDNKDKLSISYLRPRLLARAKGDSLPEIIDCILSEYAKQLLPDTKDWLTLVKAQLLIARGENASLPASLTTKYPIAQLLQADSFALSGNYDFALRAYHLVDDNGVPRLRVQKQLGILRCLTYSEASQKEKRAVISKMPVPTHRMDKLSLQALTGDRDSKWPLIEIAQAKAPIAPTTFADIYWLVHGQDQNFAIYQFTHAGSRPTYTDDWSRFESAVSHP